MLLTMIIAGVIGWQANMRVFPFNGFKWDNSGAWGVINCVFTIYNIYAIITTWFALGIMTISAIIYMLLVIGSAVLGWNHVWLHGFIWDCRNIGVIPAVKSAWESLKRKWNDNIISILRMNFDEKPNNPSGSFIFWLHSLETGWLQWIFHYDYFHEFWCRPQGWKYRVLWTTVLIWLTENSVFDKSLMKW